MADGACSDEQQQINVHGWSSYIYRCWALESALEEASRPRKSNALLEHWFTMPPNPTGFLSVTISHYLLTTTITAGTVMAAWNKHNTSYMSPCSRGFDCLSEVLFHLSPSVFMFATYIYNIQASTPYFNRNWLGLFCATTIGSEKYIISCLRLWADARHALKLASILLSHCPIPILNNQVKCVVCRAPLY